MSFDGKRVLITGASSGIGEALARELARRGAHLLLTARRVDRLEALASELSREGRQTVPVGCDISQDADVERLARQTREKLGGIDVVVANAGFGVVGSIEDLSLDDFRRQFETNVYGVLRTVKAMLPMLRESQGAVAIVGSVNGYIALPGNAPYSMSKFAVRAFADSLRLEMRPHGISVTHLAPGFIATEIRQVDNQGQWHPRAKDRVPAWIQMSAPRAAKRIARAIARGRRERVITGHGKFLVYLERHCPATVYALLRGLGVRARPEPWLK